MAAGQSPVALENAVERAVSARPGECASEWVRQDRVTLFIPRYDAPPRF